MPTRTSPSSNRPALNTRSYSLAEGTQITARSSGPSLEHIQHATRGNCDCLAAVDCKRDGVRRDGAAGLEIPERFAGAGVEGEEIALVRAAEHQPARRGEHAGPRRRMHLELPAHLAGGRFE